MTATISEISKLADKPGIFQEAAHSQRERVEAGRCCNEGLLLDMRRILAGAEEGTAGVPAGARSSAADSSRAELVGSLTSARTALVTASDCSCRSCSCKMMVVASSAGQGTAGVVGASVAGVAGGSALIA